MRRYIKERGEENNAGDPVKIADAILRRHPAGTATSAHRSGRRNTYAMLMHAYAGSLKALEAQKELAESVAFAGKTGFMLNT